MAAKVRQKIRALRRIPVFGCVILAAVGLPAFLADAQKSGPFQAPAPEFGRLAYLGNLLDQPTSLESLKTCVSRNDTPCLSLFRSERLVVQRIFSKGREAALEATLNAIKRNCSTPEAGVSDGFPWRACNGAVAAVFFFHSTEEDRQVLEFFKDLDQTDLETILISSHGCSDWVVNRPDHQKWAGFIDSLAFLDKARGGRAAFERIFLNSSHLTTGIALLDPENREAAAIRLPN